MAKWDDYSHVESKAPNTGKMRCVITKVEEKVSQSSGNDMIVVYVRPSNSKVDIRHYIVKNEYFNQNMSRFFDAFPTIGDGNFAFPSWVGAEGAANFGEDDAGYIKVKGWIPPSRAKDLPPFEGKAPEQQSISTLKEVDDDDDDMPF